MTKREDQDLKITHSEEYKKYIEALCQLASGYVSRIRVQFAEKAYDMYQNETVRRIVLAYGDELEDLYRHRLMDFRYAADFGAVSQDSLEDFPLNHARHYGATIKMLFDID